MAIALALLAVVVILALTAGSFAVGRLEMLSGRNTLYSTQAAEAADIGLSSSFGGGWDLNWNSLGTLQQSAPEQVTPFAGVQYTRTVTRLGGNIFLIESLGERVAPSGQVLGSRMLGQLVRLTTPSMSVDAAVTSLGPVTVGGNAVVDGHNVNPEGWSCGTLGPDVAGIRSASTITRQGEAAGIDGVPDSIPNDGTVTEQTIEVPWDMFRMLATLTHPGGNGQHPVPSVVGGVCDRSNVLNWGEPFRSVLQSADYKPECQEYFPIVYVSGDLSVSADSRGQGILLVDGNFTMVGQFEFVGLLIVRGEIRSMGTGAHIVGAVYSLNSTLDADFFAGEPTVDYSGCAVATVLGHSSYGEPLAQRSWVQRWQ